MYFYYRFRYILLRMYVSKYFLRVLNGKIFANQRIEKPNRFVSEIKKALITNAMWEN